MMMRWFSSFNIQHHDQFTLPPTIAGSNDILLLLSLFLHRSFDATNNYHSTLAHGQHHTTISNTEQHNKATGDGEL
jgi:hypothetical protein